MSKIILITIIVLTIIALVLFFTIIFPNINKNQTSSNTSTTQGVKIETLKPGQGEAAAKNGDSLMVNFITTLSNGQKVDSSYDRQALITFKVGAEEVIKGWDVGVLGMKVGEIRRLTIQPNFAYGTEGLASLKIPKDAILISTVELISIK